MSSGEHDPALTYSRYLALDELLNAQRPRSDEHDELLFIVIHQVYELWFKQLLHEGARAQVQLAASAASGALATLRRMTAVLKTLVAQIDVLETMTPRQFLAFRDRLGAASGFQSAQFRELEALLGRRDHRVRDHYQEGSPERIRLTAAMDRPSLFHSLLEHLGAAGYPVPAAVLRRDPAEPWVPSADVQRALLAAYRDDGPSAQLCERMIDLDEGVMEWRYRHVQMVRRTIGDKPGTGGSSGVEYLASTLMRPAFPDLWAIRTEL